VLHPHATVLFLPPCSPLPSDAVNEELRNEINDKLSKSKQVNIMPFFSFFTLFFLLLLFYERERESP